eukprot:6212799-Pleurochrysis_carterae.AAC.2
MVTVLVMVMMGMVMMTMIMMTIILLACIRDCSSSMKLSTDLNFLRDVVGMLWSTVTNVQSGRGASTYLTVNRYVRSRDGPQAATG